MVDRILHIGHLLAPEYDNDLLQRAAEVYIYKRPAAVVPHLVSSENFTPEEAETLFRKIDAAMRKINRQVLWQYAVVALIFLVLVVAGWSSQSYIFAGVFALPAFGMMYSAVRFVRRNAL